MKGCSFGSFRQATIELRTSARSLSALTGLTRTDQSATQGPVWGGGGNCRQSIRPSGCRLERAMRQCDHSADAPLAGDPIREMVQIGALGLAFKPGQSAVGSSKISFTERITEDGVSITLQLCLRGYRDTRSWSVRSPSRRKQRGR